MKMYEISLKFVPRAPDNNTPTLVQIMVWRRPGDKPSSELMMAGLLTHICTLGPNELYELHNGMRFAVIHEEMDHVSPVRIDIIIMESWYINAFPIYLMSLQCNHKKINHNDIMCIIHGIYCTYYVMLEVSIQATSLHGHIWIEIHAMKNPHSFHWCANRNKVNIVAMWTKMCRKSMCVYLYRDRD